MDGWRMYVLDSLTYVPPKRGRLSLHVIMNMMLPSPAQIKILPELGYTDGFVSINERQPVLCLLKNIDMARHHEHPPTKKKSPTAK